MLDIRDPRPLYQQVEDDLREKIAQGEIKVGEQLESQQVLARRYGVSLITIKRALNDLISEGILFSRAGKGTFVARRTPGVDYTRHPTIGLVLRDLNSPFFSLILQKVEELASENKYNLLLSSSANRLEKEEDLVEHFLEIGVNGLIIASMSHVYHATPVIRKLHESGYPYVMVSYIEDEEIYWVGTDNVKGGYLAGEHLAKLGYRKVGYINGEEGNLPGERRKEGLLRALRDYGIEFNPKFEFRLRLRGEWNDYRSGYEIGEHFVTLTDRPEAMFVYNDLSALGFQRAVLDRGLRVPDDVAIVGFDDIKRGQVAPVPLTTIRQPTDEIGAVAFEKLVKLMQNEPVESRTTLEPRLVVRESCGAAQRSEILQQDAAGSQNADPKQ